MAFDLTLSEGRGVSGDLLREVLEEALPETIEEGPVVYGVSVLGVGTSVKDMQASMALRRQQ